MYMQTSTDGVNWIDTDLISSDWNSTQNGITRFNYNVYSNGILFFDNCYYVNIYETTTELSPSGQPVYITYTKTYKSTNKINWDISNITSNKTGYIANIGRQIDYKNDADYVVKTNKNAYMPLLKYDA